MSFWLRYGFLVLVCIVGPLGYAFYEDTQSMISRVEAAGLATAEIAPSSLNSQLTLRGQEAIGRASALAQEAAAARLSTTRRKPPETLLSAMSRLAVEGESLWIIDDKGAVLLRSGQTEVEDTPELITGVPLYRATQEGFALDGFWNYDDRVYFVGAAPVVVAGEAAGAVFAMRPVDLGFVQSLARTIGTDLTLLTDDETLASTLPSAAAESVIEATQHSRTPVLGGRLDKPIQTKVGAGLLPLFVPKDGDGLAYVSVAVPTPNKKLEWLISVPAAKSLNELGVRQQSILGILAIAILVALFIGYRLHRNYVRPIGLIVEHLSEFNLRDGERELSEYQVPGPLRRLVKLVNMTVQRIPTSTRAQMSLTGTNAALSRETAAEPASLMDGLDEDLLETGVSHPAHTATKMAPPPKAPAPAATGAALSVGDLLGGEDDEDHVTGPDANLDFKDVSSELGRALSSSADGITTDSAVPTQPKRKASEIRGAQPRAASEIRGAPSDRLATGPSFSGPGLAFGSGGLSGGPPPPPPPTGVGPAPSPPNPFGGLSDLGDTQQNEVLGYLGKLPSTGGARVGGSAGLQMGGSAASGEFGRAGIPEEDAGGFRSESTVVSAPDDDLLARSVAGGLTGHFQFGAPDSSHRPPERTVVADVPQDLIDRSAEVTGQMSLPDEFGLDAADNAHFQETYERFVEMRRACGEPTGDLAFDKFVAKLRKNREGLIEKYSCRTVRFQVYKKDGKAALKATPIRA